MLVGAMEAEIQPGGECHVLGFQEVRAERLRVVGECAHIGVQVERTLRLDFDAEAQFAQCRQQEIAALAERLAALLEDRHRFLAETGEGGMLSDARRADVQVLCQLLQIGHGRRRCHQPAQPPAGHAEVLGKTVQHERAVIHLQHAGRIQAVGQAVIDLVHHQMAAPRVQGLRQGGQFVGGKHGAGRVGRRGDQRADAVGVPVLFHQRWSQLVGGFRPDRHQLRTAFHQAQEVAVARITWVGQQPVATRIDQQAAGQQQRTGAAGGDQDAFGIDVQPVVAAIETTDGLAQGRQATCGGVAGMAGGQCGLAGTHDRFGRGEVRFADFQVDHIVAGLFQRLCAGQQRHHVERSDFMAAPAVARRVGQGTHLPMVRRSA